MSEEMESELVRERTGAEEGQIIMPFYLICDVSSSMTGDMPTLNEGIRRLRRAIVAQPQVDDVARSASSRSHRRPGCPAAVADERGADADAARPRQHELRLRVPAAGADHPAGHRAA